VSQLRLEEIQVADHALLMRRKPPICKVALIPRRQNQKQTETSIEMRDKVTGERYEWKTTDQEAELALNGLTICPNEIKAHQLDYTKSPGYGMAGCRITPVLDFWT
jgi:hypothetical protein